MQMETFECEKVEQLSEKQLNEVKGGAIGAITVMVDDI